MSSFLVLSEDWELSVPIQKLHQRNIDVLQLPVPDFQGPSLDDIIKGYDVTHWLMHASYVVCARASWGAYWF